MKKSACFILLVLQLACKPIPESKPVIGTVATLRVAREMMERSSCTFVTVNDKSLPYARVMDPLAPDQNFVVWLATNPRSRKVQHVSANPNVVLHYVDQDENGYVSLYGQAELVKDTLEMESHWKPEWDKFYRNKSSDCLLIKVKPTRLEVIDYKHGLSGDPVSWQPTVIVF
jgi:general stress protein 26